MQDVAVRFGADGSVYRRGRRKSFSADPVEPARLAALRRYRDLHAGADPAALGDQLLSFTVALTPAELLQALGRCEQVLAHVLTPARWELDLLPFKSASVQFIGDGEVKLKCRAEDGDDSGQVRFLDRIEAELQVGSAYAENHAQVRLPGNDYVSLSCFDRAKATVDNPNAVVYARNVSRVNLQRARQVRLSGLSRAAVQAESSAEIALMEGAKLVGEYFTNASELKQGGWVRGNEFVEAGGRLQLYYWEWLVRG